MAAGVRQYVLLGAGLDTFAYRNPFVGVRYFAHRADGLALHNWIEHLVSAWLPVD
ncbi:methyltransferase [Melittangium boletus DSM 14713]|uniref:Methyltransferase n=1 Tax=Melittangium boletus DSM 14713 TaxID=1294270 RepID=A0A250INY5_9BACT|nr:methyltransferase [Melittangium boletus DSM 14713]